MIRELELLDRLIAFPTVSDQSNLDLIDWAQDILRSAGFQTTRIPQSDGFKAGLHATLGPQENGGVCLSAHTDVVPVSGQNWTRDPFKLTREGPYVFGRGTTDMKGFVACALAAAERASTLQLTRPFSLVLSYDEEVGCVGIREMMPKLSSLLGSPEIVVVGEPTSMQVAVGHKGKAAFTVTCHGEAGHSALAPRYRNAIHLAAGFVHEIRRVQDNFAQSVGDPSYEIPYATFHIGKIRGGRALNIVPDTATMDMEIRYPSGAPVEALTASLNDAARRVCAREACENAITIETGVAYPCLENDASAASIAVLKKIVQRETTTKVAFGTEGGFFAELGLNAVVMGPGNMAQNGHKPDECIETAELAACAAALDNLVKNLAT